MKCGVSIRLFLNQLTKFSSKPAMAFNGAEPFGIFLYPTAVFQVVIQPIGQTLIFLAHLLSPCISDSYRLHYTNRECKGQP